MSTRGVHRDDMFDDDPTIAAFARDLQRAAAATPAPAVGASLAAVFDGRAPAAVPPEVVAALPRARRSFRLRWAAAAAAFGIGAGSLGVAGALPGPVQRQVSRLADVVGVELPDGRGDSDPVPTIPSEPLAPPSSVVVPPRPSVVPPDDRPVPSTVPDDPDNRGNREDRGRGPADDRGSDRSRRPAAEDVGVPEDLDDEDGSGRGRSGVDEEQPDSRLEKVGAGRNPSMVTGVHSKD